MFGILRDVCRLAARLTYGLRWVLLLLAERGGVVGGERRGYWQECYRPCAVS